MLNLIETGGAEGILVWKLDRLVRRPAEFEGSVPPVSGPGCSSPA